MTRACVLALLLALTGTVAVTTGAGAAGPAPCQGLFVEDAPNDVADADGNVAGTQKGQPNEEIEALYFTVRGGVTTAHIQIANLDKKLGSGYASGDGGIYYYVYFSHGGNTQFVKAVNADGATITYGYGRVYNPGVFVTDGETKGAFAEGPHGVVSIEIPADIGGKPGETLGGAYASVDTIEGKDDVQGFNRTMDATVESPNPVEPNGTDYKVTECPAGTSGPAPVVPGPSPQSSAPPPATLGLTVPATLGSAKLARRRRFLAVKATAKQEIVNLRAVLKPAKGGPAVATARVARFGPGTRVLKLKATKRLKAGRYVFAAEGDIAGGHSGQTRLVTVRR